MSAGNLIPSSPGMRQRQDVENIKNDQTDQPGLSTRDAARGYATLVICLFGAATIGWLFLLGWVIKRFI